MYYNIEDAKYVRDFTIWVRFQDGTQGEVDLASELWGPVFEPLRDPEYFRKLQVAEYGTVAWPNGADVAPEFLYERVNAARGSAKTQAG